MRSITLSGRKRRASLRTYRHCVGACSTRGMSLAKYALSRMLCIVGEKYPIVTLADTSRTVLLAKCAGGSVACVSPRGKRSRAISVDRVRKVISKDKGAFVNCVG